MTIFSCIFNFKILDLIVYETTGEFLIYIRVSCTPWTPLAEIFISVMSTCP